jgi:hypothetical protein
MKTTKKMAYKKPRLIAKNNPTGSFAAGCPTHNGSNGTPGASWCRECEVTG